MKTEVMKPEQFEMMLNEKLSEPMKKRIREKELRYSELTDNERDSCIRLAVDILLDNGLITKSGKHRQTQWESGWTENLEDYRKTRHIKALTPKYYGKHDYIRFGGRLIKISDKDTEYKIYEILNEYIFEKFLKQKKNIFEFGCGPAHNIMHIRTLPDKRDGMRFVGLDWAFSSQEIICELNQDGFHDVEGKNFDYFKPDYSIKFPPETAVFTFASLEQIGSDYKAFLEYLIHNKAEICINVEPVLELLDADNLIDYLALKYMEKRNYLNGYLTELRRLESEGVIEILKTAKTGIGSMFGESASIIVWRVL